MIQAALLTLATVNTPQTDCPTLLTALSASRDEATIARKIAQTYMDLVEKSQSDLVTLQELRSALAAGDPFEFEEGSSSKDHFRAAMQQLRDIARAAVADPTLVSTEIKHRLTVHINAAEATKKSRESEQERRCLPGQFLKRIVLPDPGTSSYSTAVTALSPHGTTALVKQSLSEQGWSDVENTRFFFVTTDPGKEPAPRLLQIRSDALKRDFYYANSNQISADGSILSSVLRLNPESGAQNVLLADTTTGELLQEYSVKGKIRYTALSPDGNKIIIFGETDDEMPWSVADTRMKSIKELPIPERLKKANLEAPLKLYGTVYSNKGSIVALKAAHYTGNLHRNFVVFWDLDKNEILDDFVLDTVLPISQIKFTPDDSKALIGLSDGVAMRDFRRHTNLFSLQLPSSTKLRLVDAFAFSKDSKLIAASYAKESEHDLRFLGVWDASNGNAVLSEFPDITIASDFAFIALDLAFNGDFLTYAGVTHKQTFKYTFRLSDGRVDGKYFSPLRSNSMLGRGSRNGNIRVEVDGNDLTVWNINEVLGIEP